MSSQKRPQQPEKAGITSCRKVDYERAAFLSDWHYPYEDKHTVELTLRFLSWFQPDALWLVGDYMDFYQISKFDKDPLRCLALQDDLDKGKTGLRRLRKTCPGARIVYMDGNHEDRLRRYLWTHPELSSLDSLTIPAQLELYSDDIEAEYFGYHQPQRWHGLHLEHGNRVSKHSAATAKTMLESRGVSGASGHTHRMGCYFRTDELGMKAWWELGCMCGLNPEYVIGSPNWQ